METIIKYGVKPTGSFLTAQVLSTITNSAAEVITRDIMSQMKGKPNLHGVINATNVHTAVNSGLLTIGVGLIFSEWSFLSQDPVSFTIFILSLASTGVVSKDRILY